MKDKLLKLVALVEYELETFYSRKELKPPEEKDKRDLEEAVEWLKKNLDYIIADAEYDSRL